MIYKKKKIKSLRSFVSDEIFPDVVVVDDKSCRFRSPQLTRQINSHHRRQHNNII